MALMTPESMRRFDLVDAFERAFEHWPEGFVWPMFGWRGDEGVLWVDEYREAGALVVRADVPGIDPDRDVNVTVSEGVMHIEVERHEPDGEGRTYLRHEVAHPRHLVRDLTLPEGADGGSMQATYDNGVLEIRLSLPEPAAAEVTRVPVRRAA